MCAKTVDPNAKSVETFTPFDAADYLRDEDDILAFLEAACEDGDAAHISSALDVVVRAAARMNKLSEDTGISRQGLLKALSEDGNPSLDTVMRVVRALGLRITFKAD